MPPKISIITISARPGFIGDAVRNLQKQTFKDFEWIIVDSLYYERKNEVAEFMKDKGINYLHVPDKVCFVEHPYRLNNAFNTGVIFARGELTVWWQDFIRIREDGLQKFWDLHIKEPCFITCGDERWNITPPENPDNMIDLWNKEPELLEKEKGCWRCLGKDLRVYDKPENHGEFELNWAATSTSIIRELGGFDERLDEGFNWDNNWLAWRALYLGYKVYFDETNLATMYNHWQLFTDKKYSHCCDNREGGVRANAVLFQAFTALEEKVKMKPFHLNN